MEGKGDILISIQPAYMANIVSRVKTHEFRKYLIPKSVKRMWFYITAPCQRLQYIAIISKGKEPGEIDAADDGLGNVGFNEELKESKFAYEILQLYELKTPLSLRDLINREFVKGAPQKYQWVSEEMLSSILLEDQNRIFWARPNIALFSKKKTDSKFRAS